MENLDMVIQCKTLLGSKNLDFSIACLQSFIQNSYDEVHLQIFEDGSIDEQHENKLLRALPNSTIVKKAIRNEVIEDKLAAYPNCLKFRNENVLAQKLFDIALFKEEDIFFIDSDIYFLKKFKLPAIDKDPVFIYDTQNAYSFHPANFLNVPYKIFPSINTGFFYFPYKLFNVVLLEEILSNKNVGQGFTKYKVWAEQTLWAFLSAPSQQINYFDPAQIAMARKQLLFDEHTVAIHLVSSYRYHYKELSETTQQTGSVYTDVKLLSTQKHLSKVNFLIERVNKIIGRYLTR